MVEGGERSGFVGGGGGGRGGSRDRGGYRGDGGRVAEAPRLANLIYHRMMSEMRLSTTDHMTPRER